MTELYSPCKKCTAIKYFRKMGEALISHWLMDLAKHLVNIMTLFLERKK